MPGRFLDVLNRVTRSESFKSQKSDASSKGSKKVSFDSKVKDKQFKARKKRKQRPLPSIRDLKPSRTDKRRSGDREASNEFWFNVSQHHDSPTAASSTPDDQSALGEQKLPRKVSRIPPASPLPRTMHSSSATYKYDMEPGLHPSQQPSAVPRVKRNLVRNIVAQFNEEAQKRHHRRSSENLLDDVRATSPQLIEATPDNAPNHNQPFSYTAVGEDSPEASPLGPRSKSNYDLQKPSDLIYAQVVVNGHNHTSKGSDGRYKTTIHTKVPNRSTGAKTSTPNHGSTAFADSRRLFSKSTGNLHRQDSEERKVMDYQHRNKKTDNSYYKFDPVDDEQVAPSAVQNGKSSKTDRKWTGKQLLRSSSAGVDADNNDSVFEPSRHQLIHLPDAGGLMKKDGAGGGGYETRNVEKWSEKEVGPNSHKFTEREFIHEVSVSDDRLRDSPKTNGRPLTRTFHERKEDKKHEKFYHSDRSSDSTNLKKSRHRHEERTENESTKHIDRGQRNKKEDASTTRWQSSKSSESVENSTVPPAKPARSSPADNPSKSIGLSQYYFGERTPVSSSPTEIHRQERLSEAEEYSTTWQKKSGSSGSGHFNGFLSTSSHRRNSNDSGSGVGLLSSKLVKQANAEVNGYRNGAESDEEVPFKYEPRGRSRRQHENSGEGDSRLRRNEKFASTSWLNRGDLEPTGGDPFRRYDAGSLESSPLSDKYLGTSGYTTEQRRHHIRKEETKRTTKRETRTVPSVDYDSDDEERRRMAQQSKERSESRDSSADRGQHQQRRALQSRTEDGMYWNGGGSAHSPLGKSIAEEQQHKMNTSEHRKVDIGIRQKKTTATSQQRHQTGGAFGDDYYDDRMETSESEPQLYSGSQDSHMSLGSRFSSAEEEEQHRIHEEDEEEERANIIAAHVNTPQSMVKQMNKQQISYENSQHRHQEGRETGRRFWFERSNDEVDSDVRRSHTRLDANRNHFLKNQNRNHSATTTNNNHAWTSATMSRLETAKNRRNNQNDAERHRMANTMDHRRKGGDDIRFQLNDRDVPREALANGKHRVDRSPSFGSRVGSYHSENEGSQHSGGSSSSTKKRVNFKAKSSGGAKRGVYGSNADLSPIHREALLRSASPARAPSTTGSMRSNESDASHGSNRSVIIHKTVEADIGPARQYQVRSANTSPAPPASVISAGGGSRETHTVQRSFSLLSPWKPRKYKDKYEKQNETVVAPPRSAVELENGGSRRRSSYHEEQQRHLAKQHHKHSHQDGEAVSHNSSSERLDSLSPLPSEGPVTKSKSKKKTGLFRRHSMPKDSRFANFFRRKKESGKS